MLDWKQRSNGRSALLIEGPRRVGKSTVAGEFARREYESCIIVNFDTALPQTLALFDDLSDISYIFLMLQAQYNVHLKERRSVIVFDEVQLCPKARQAIKHFVKDGRYDFIETGSLISIRKNVKDIIIPSEETRLALHPLDYEEFCMATGKDALPSLLREIVKSGKTPAESLHRKMMRDFRIYMLTGGMPQAVTAYLESNDFSKVDEVKRSIISLYEEDFLKIDPKGRCSLLFDSIPAQLAKNVSRYQVSGVLRQQRAASAAHLISWMQDSGTVSVSYHADDPNAGMAAVRDPDCFKLFLADTGLFVTLMFKDADFTKNSVYLDLLNDRSRANLGYLYENMTAQILSAQGLRLYYYTFDKEASERKYEIDFLIPDGSKVIPVEVKSSGYATHRSLDAFCAKYSQRISKKLMVTVKNLKKDQDILQMPICLLPFYLEAL